MTELHKDRKHDHYWVEDGILHESYRTIRGMRWRALMRLPKEFEDIEKCDDEYMDKVRKHLA